MKATKKKTPHVQVNTVMETKKRTSNDKIKEEFGPEEDCDCELEDRDKWFHQRIDLWLW